MFSACLRGYPAPAALAAPMVSVDSFADNFNKAQFTHHAACLAENYDDTNMKITEINYLELSA